jgi:ribokinase
MERLIHALERKPPESIVVTMPDFFVDHFVHYHGDVESFTKRVITLAKQGGGDLPLTYQSIFRGGNAANTASALAKWGFKSYLIARTSKVGKRLSRMLMRGVDLSHVKTDGKLAMTVAMELRGEKGGVNIMINDPGSVADFGFERLTQDDVELLKAADVVCVFNWNLNQRGTNLAKNVFKLVKKRGKGMTYFDSGDPSLRVDDVSELMSEVLKRELVDVFSVNENEALWYASEFKDKLREKRGVMSSTKLALECASILRVHVKARVDLHTASLSASFDGRKRALVRTFKTNVKRLTGAGDVWNAANIYGYILKLDPRDRLTLANAAAALYISDEMGEHPSRRDLIRFLRGSFG